VLTKTTVPATNCESNMLKASKIVMVTGGNTGIGKSIAKIIAKHPTTKEVIVVGRNKEKCERAVSDLKATTNFPNISYEIADLSLYSSIKDLATRYKQSGKSLHVIVNNAAVVPKNRETTSEGIELAFATNVLGYYWMMTEFREILTASAPSRVVNVASNYAGGLDITDLQFEAREYNENTAYTQSKQADRMLAGYFGKTWKNLGISVNACHPGVVNTKLLKDLGFNHGGDTEDSAAATPAFVAMNEEGENNFGKYFVGKQLQRCRFSENFEASEQLVNACEAMTKTIKEKLSL